VHTLAIDIGGTKVSVARIDFLEDSPHVVEVLSEKTQDLCQLNAMPTAADIVAWVNQAAEQLIRTHGDVGAIGVGFGGQFDSQEQLCIKSLHIEGWDNFPLNDLFPSQSRLSTVPIVGRNDAKAAAVAEATAYMQSGTLRRSAEFFAYITMSTGIGAAFAVLPPGGAAVEVWDGENSLAGEFGHLQIPRPAQIYSDQLCACGGTACLERLCSGLWIQQRTGLSAHAYLSDEANFNNWIADFTAGIWSAITVLDPSVICIGGGMSAMGGRLTDALTQSLGRYCSVWGRKPPEVTLAHWGGRSVLLGAALLARETGTT